MSRKNKTWKGTIKKISLSRHCVACANMKTLAGLTKWLTNLIINDIFYRIMTKIPSDKVEIHFLKTSISPPPPRIKMPFVFSPIKNGTGCMHAKFNKTEKGSYSSEFFPGRRCQKENSTGSLLR